MFFLCCKKHKIVKIFNSFLFFYTISILFLSQKAALKFIQIAKILILAFYTFGIRIWAKVWTLMKPAHIKKKCVFDLF